MSISEQRQALRSTEQQDMYKTDQAYQRLVALPDNDDEKMTHYKRVNGATFCFRNTIKSVNPPGNVSQHDLDQLWAWFNDKKPEINEIMQDYPVGEFPDMGISEQRLCQRKCKNLFIEFKTLFSTKHADKTNLDNKSFFVCQNDVLKAGDIILDMNKLLSFEWIPQVEEGSFRQMKMKPELRETVSYFAETKVWPDEMISVKSRYKFFIVAMQTEGKDILQTLSDNIDCQMSIYSDADYSDILDDLNTAKQVYERQLELAVDR